VRFQTAYASPKAIVKTVRQHFPNAAQRWSGHLPSSGPKKVIHWAETLRAGMAKQMELWQKVSA
jgi:hypothetical protein